MRTFIKPLPIVLLLIGVLLIPFTAGAQPTSIISASAGCDFASGEFDASCIPQFLAHVIQFFFGLSGGYFLVQLLIGGYKYVLGSAVPGQDSSEGKQHIQQSILGFLVVLLAYYIVEFIIATFVGNVSGL